MKKKPNPVAKALRNPVCKQQIVNSKKVYNRKKVFKNEKNNVY